MSEPDDQSTALTAARERLAQQPDSGRAHLALARLLAEGGALDEATPHFREALFLLPGEPEPLVEFALLHMATGALAPAIELLQRCLRQHPGHPPALFHLGCVAATMADADAARARFEAYLTVAPSDPLGAGARLAALTEMPRDRLAPAFVRAVFDQYAHGYDEHLVIRLRYRGPEILRAVVDRVRGDTAPLADVLDLGCGTGLCGLAFRPLARRLVGVDLSPAMVGMARDRKLYEALHVGDAMAVLAATPRAWDLIVAADVLVYVGDLAPLFDAVALALRPGGLFAATVEAGVGADYALQPTKRFAHHADYVATAAAQARLAVAVMESAVTRRERDMPVAGHVFVLRHSG